MYVLVLFLGGINSVFSNQVTHNTGLGNCVYTFNVPRTQNTCPPGAVEGNTDDLKRLIESGHSELSEHIHNLTRMIAELSGSKHGGDNDGKADQGSGFKSGTHYTRWGHTECPSTADLLYTGYAAKAHASNGGGVDFQCLPLEPEFPPGGATGHQSQSYIYGVEYERHNSPLVPQAKQDYDVPCAVCHVNIRGEEIMIPVKLTCPAGWTKEYEGVLMAQHHSQHGSTFVCVDKEMQVLQGHQNQDGGLLYVVEAQCGSLRCPPYQSGFEFSCVVCTL